MPPVTRSKAAPGHRTTKRRRLDADPQPQPQPQTKPTATIDDLPDELLEPIARYLNFVPEKDFPPPEPDEKPARKQWRPRRLHPLSLVSKRFNRIANPLLYSIFVNDQQPIALYQFLRTVMHNPHLAAHVRSVAIGAFDQDELGDQYRYDVSQRDFFRFEAMRPDIIKRAKKIDFGTQKDARKPWLEQLEARNFEADVSFLLTQTPNLEVLDLETFAIGLQRLYACTFNLVSLAVPHGNRNGIQGLFANLRHVILTDQDTLDYTAEHSFLEILHFPSLRALDVRFILETTREFVKLEKRSSSVEELLLEEVFACPWLAPMLIHACRRLKQLVYKFGDGFLGAHDHGETTCFDDMRSAVLVHKESLETLVLQTEFSDLEKPVSAIGPLKDLQRLRHLVISGVLLFDNLGLDGPYPTLDSVRELLERGSSPCQEFFPQSLQSLEIEIYSVPTIRAPLILFLLVNIREGRKHGLLPELRRIKIKTRAEDETGDYWRDVVGEAGMAIGLEKFSITTLWRVPDDVDSETSLD